MGIGKGVGVCNVLQQPGMNLWLAIIQTTNAVSFIHSSLVNPLSLLSITIVVVCDQIF